MQGKKCPHFDERRASGSDNKRCKICGRAYRVRHPLKITWERMVDRCTNPNSHAWKDYGGRGISVAAVWMRFEVFEAAVLAELGPRPAGHSLDRIDNSKNYEPGNIRWATATMQIHNSRVAKLNRVSVLCIRELARRGATRKTIALAFGVHVMNVGKILRGETWQEVADG